MLGHKEPAMTLMRDETVRAGWRLHSSTAVGLVADDSLPLRSTRTT